MRIRRLPGGAGNGMQHMKHQPGRSSNGIYTSRCPRPERLRLDPLISHSLSGFMQRVSFYMVLLIALLILLLKDFSCFTS